MVEVRTGVALNGTTIEESFAATNTTSLVDLVRQASVRLTTPHEARRYVGIAGFRSEEQNRSLDGLAESLGGILPLELGNAPRVVVLDRENLTAIANEDVLTGAGVELRPATTWVEGALRRLPEDGRLRVTLLFHPLPEGETRRVTLAVAGNFSEVVRAVTRAVTEELNLVPAPGAKAGLEAEAARFAQRATQLHSHQKYEPAARAMDAALALAPSQEHRLRAAGYWNDVGVYAHGSLERIYQGRKAPLEDAPSVALQIQFLTVRLRASELYRDVLREHVAAHRSQPALLSDVPKIKPNSLRGLEQLPPQGVAAAAEPLRRELQRVHLEIYRVTRECHEADWENPRGRQDSNYHRHAQGRWCWHVGVSLAHFGEWTDDLDEWIALTHEVIRDLKTRSFDGTVPRYPCFVWERLAGNGLQRQLPAGENQRLVDFYESLTGDANEHVRLIALGRLHGLATAPTRRHDVPSARRMMDDFIKSFPVDHPTRVAMKDYLYPFIVVHSPLVNALVQNGEGDRYLHAILDPIIQQRLSSRMVAWSGITRSWMNYLEVKKRTDELLPLADALFELIESSPPEPKLEEFVIYLRGVRERFGLAEPRASGAWAEYSFQEIKLTGRPPASHLRAVLWHDGALLLAWAARTGQSDIAVELTRSSPAGGIMQSLGRTVIKAGLRHGQDMSVVHIVPATNAIYVRSENGGVAVFRDGGVLALTETNGLPQDSVPWLVALRGRAYLGYHGALFDYDPVSGRFTELASSSSLAPPRHGLDGGDRFGLRGLVADEQRNCLWLALGGTRADGRAGLWKYSPDSGALKKVSGLAPNQMHWQRGGLAGWTATNWTIVNIAPDTLAVTPLLGFNLSNAYGAPIFGTHDGLSDPRLTAWLGDHLLTGWDVLALRTADARAPWERRTLQGEIVALDEMSDGRVLLATDPGDVWLIRRNKIVSKQISRP